MLLELLNEFSVDSVCTYVELKNDIDVFECINEIDHPLAFVGWVNILAFSVFFSLNAFKTVPNFVFCSSTDPCSCSKIAFPLYTELCESASKNHTSSSAESDQQKLLEDTTLVKSSLGSIANISTVLIGALVVLVMVAIICVSLTWVQRRKEKLEMEEMQRALSAKELR